MVIVADSLPGLKRWLAPLGLKESAKLLVIRVVDSGGNTGLAKVILR